ncbi:MAG TPA: FadR/GntR family transcriptional regulator [Desulfopila sp.]|nr:FadR/GntR family transcriptional regulator [Desulfopila sp.]
MILETTTTVDAIVNLLKKRICSGIYHPGDKLPSERVLQQEMGVGRLALREALSRLGAIGITATSHGRGTFVQGIVKSATLADVLVPYGALSDPKRLEDLVLARGMIESEIAGIAALQRTEKQLEMLWGIVEYPFSATTSSERVAAQDLRFHRMLAESIDNTFLATMHAALTDHIEMFLRAFVKSKNNPAEVMEPHRSILKAIEERDSDAARYHARVHVTYSFRDYEEYILQTGEGGAP